MRTVTLNLDNCLYNDKPTVGEIRSIQKRISTCKRTVTVEELAIRLHNGATMKAAALNGNKNVDWESQEVFALDFDNSEKDVEKFSYMTVERALGRCKEYNLHPAFYYESFSSTEDRVKFRLVFISDVKITDIRVRNVVQMALMNIFPESDKACKDLSRIFFGSKQKAIQLDYEGTISVVDVVQAMVAYVQATDRAHAARIIKSYCQTVGLNMINGLPDVQVLEGTNFGENTGNSILYIIEEHAKSPKTILNFNVEVGVYSIQVKNTEGKAKGPKVEIETTKVKREVIEKFDFDNLESSCELWAGFINGIKLCKHDEIFSIACTMWRVKGAESRMIKAVDENNYKNTNNKINTIKSCRAYGYAPRKCVDFCEIYNNCSNNGKIMLHAVENKRAAIRQVDEISTISLDEAEQALREAVERAYNEDDNKVYVIKAPTGIGKTSALNNLHDYNNLCIAYPNHRLGIDIVDRLEVENAVHVKELVMDDTDTLNEFRRLQSVGAYKQARDYLQDYTMKLISGTVQGSAERDEAIKVVEVINEYFDALDQCRRTNNTVFCTHKRMLDLNNREIHRYIIDEDIVLSALVQTLELDVAILDSLIDMADKSEADITKGQLITIKNQVLIAQDKPGQAFKLPAFLIKEKEVNKIIDNNKNNIEVNLKEVLKIRIVTANISGGVLGMSVAELPNKKCIILSATANEIVYRALLSDRDVEFIDLGNVEIEGKLILHYTGFSRSALNKDIEKAITKIRKEAPAIDNIITFAKQEMNFKKAGFNPIAHFGACSGLDGYKGQDLIVAGTPHVDERVYFLLATAIRDNIVIEQGIEYTNVKRNGFEFYFNTYNSGNVTKTDNLLQEIQFYLIETELIQAVGRARILRTAATVHLFSNCPLKEATLY